MPTTAPMQKLLRITRLTHSSTLAPFSSGHRPHGKYLPDHPILALLEEAHHHHHIDLRALHAHTITSGLIRDTFAASRVVQFCLRPNSDDPKYAAAVFGSLDRPDVYTWNAVIAGHIAHGSPESGVGCYFHMRAGGAPPNNYTFALLVKACVVAGRGVGHTAREVHGQVLKCGVEDSVVVRNSLTCMYCNMGLLEDARHLFDKSLDLDLVSWNTMISAYGRNGAVAAARDLFDIMPQRSLVSWSAMIDAYVGSGDFSRALGLYSEMLAQGFEPDVVALVSVLKACAHLGALDQGRWVHLYIDEKKLGRDANVVLGTALVDMYCKCGCIDVALQVFNGVRDRDRDVVLWNVMINGLAMHGHGKGAMELFERMRKHAVAPNESTFLGVLCACSHAGMVRKGTEIFESMKKDHNVEPRREHYGCLADLFGRAGLVKEAEDVILQMPMEPHASQWGALMSACRTHKNIEVGERVGKRLISLEPRDGGRYVLLANTYAAAGRWDDARDTRRRMEAMGARKETGCSFIE